MSIFSQRFLRSKLRKRGFTLIELLVVMSIMVILTAILMVRQSKFDSSTLLRSLTYSVALSVRQAQVYGTSVFGTTTAQANCTNGTYQNGACFAQGYGIYFNASTPTSYILFADLDNDGKYNNTGSGIPEQVKVFTLGQGYNVSKICATTSGVTPTQFCSGGGVTWLSVLYRRPNPEACITTNLQPSACVVSASPVYATSSVQIKFTGDDVGSARDILINSTGQISVGNAIAAGGGGVGSGGGGAVYGDGIITSPESCDGSNLNGASCTSLGFTGGTLSCASPGSFVTTSCTSPAGNPSITSASTANGTVGSAFSYTITATNSPTSYGASGLPSGLSVNTSSGVISGTPTTSTGSPFSVSISATNSSGSGGATLTLTIAAGGGGTPVANYTSSPSYNTLPAGTAPIGVSFINTSTGSPTPTYDWNWGDGSSHSTLTSPSHTFSTAGNYTVTLTATNSNGSNVKSHSLYISGGTLTCSPASHGSPATFTASGGVPPYAWIPVEDTSACTQFAPSGTNNQTLNVTCPSGTYHIQSYDQVTGSPPICTLIVP